MGLGELSVDGEFICLTLDPLKVPPGTYKVVKYMSPHFHYLVPLFEAVPGHTEIEIHIGNFPKDTTGCFLIGLTKDESKAAIYSSGFAFKRLMNKLEAGFLQNDVTATVENCWETENRWETE